MFTKEDYFAEYSEFYRSGDEGGSGGAEYKRSQAYYDLPSKGV